MNFKKKDTLKIKNKQNFFKSTLIIGCIAIGLVFSGNLASVKASSPRGYQTNLIELATIKTNKNIEPYKTAYNALLIHANSPTYWPIRTPTSISGSQSCTVGTYDSPKYLAAGTDVFAKVLAYRLTDNSSYAYEARKRILDLTDTNYWGGEVYVTQSMQCALNLSWNITNWVMAADLLEGYSGWTSNDKTSFQKWLAEQVYKKTAWASRVRGNNWGTIGSMASAIIADYLISYGPLLKEVKPLTISIDASTAVRQHNDIQKLRIQSNNPLGKLDIQECTIHGIQSYGGNPEELRRGSSGCAAKYIVAVQNYF